MGQKDAYLNQSLVQTERSIEGDSFWWQRINDPLLDQYVTQLLQQNLALKQAGERVLQARAGVQAQGAAFIPSITGTAGASHGFAKSPLTDTRVFSDSYSAGLETSWQVDLFGRIRRSVEAADARFGATIYDREALAQSLVAELLNRRVAIAVDKNLLDLAQKSAENRRNILDLVQRRYDLGTMGTSLADVYLAQQNYASVQADVSAQERLLAEDSYKLDVLLGQLPGTTDPLASNFPLLPPPFDAPLCLPADLLDRRPDLRASELRLKAANADIGIAIANLYPSLTLGGSLGFSGDSTHNLLTADGLAGSVLGSIMMRIFEGGALRANIDIQKSKAREMAALYAENILEAMREVETTMKADSELAQELTHVQHSANSLAQAENLATDRYQRGILSLQNYLDIQQKNYAAQQLLLVTQQKKWAARVSLYLALGGDWFNEDSEEEDKGRCGRAINE